ncbi:hypothetical protein L7F22_041939 [Adiantum nelumboides]|nr:hypothetical protein [Adiantum nelumboides]
MIATTALLLLISAAVSAVYNVMQMRRWNRRAVGQREGFSNVTLVTSEGAVYVRSPPTADGIEAAIPSSIFDREKLLPARCSDSIDADVAGSNPSTAIDCSICLEQLENGQLVRVLPTCAHTFHAPCIDSWIATDLFFCSCPCCRILVAIPSQWTPLHNCHSLAPPNSETSPSQFGIASSHA